MKAGFGRPYFLVLRSGTFTLSIVLCKDRGKRPIVAVLIACVKFCCQLLRSLA